jgi:molybdate transport system substrate-binding protein
VKRLLTPLLCALFPAATSASAELLVSAAASLSDVLPEIVNSPEAAGGERIIFNFASSSSLVSQVEAGAPVDVLITADEETMGRLDRASLLAPGTLRPLLGNRLAVIVPRGSKLGLRDAADLARPAVRRIALADPAAVPAGKYSRAWLERRGVWGAVEGRLVPTLNVRAALAAVAAKEADVGVVYATDLAASPAVELAFTVPPGEAPRIVYPVAVIATSKHPEAAKKLVEFLQSPESRAAFARFGFAAPTP